MKMKTKTTIKTLEPNLLRFVLRNDKSRAEQFLKQKSEWDSEELGLILWRALRHGALEIASMLVKAGANVNLKNPHDKTGSSFLHELLVASNQSSFDKIKKYHDLAHLMIEHGANVNACNKNGKSVLQNAILSGNSVDIIKRLLAYGARGVKFNNSFYLHRNAPTIIPLILARDSLYNKSRREQAAEALHFISTVKDRKEKWLTCAKAILAMNFPVRRMQSSGSTLRNAIESKNLELLEALIEHGFDLDKPAEDGKSPLHVTSKFKESDITELLIRGGANVNFSADKVHGYPIHAACQELSLKNIQVLLRHGADINLRDSANKTPFSLIYYHGIKNGTEANKMFVKHLAILKSKGKSVNDCDLNNIQSYIDLRNYYEKCMKELKMMTNLIIINETTILNIFKEDITELLSVTRNVNFQEKFDLLRWTKQFPIFHKDMKVTLKNAKNRKKLLHDQEQAFRESLKPVLPNIPMEKIINYLYM